MHIALINQFYLPTGAPTGLLLGDLARTLRDRGHRVTVVTSPGLYGIGAGSLPPEEEGIAVRRAGPSRRHSSAFAGKLVDYVRFFPAAYRALNLLSPAPDAVVCMTTPPFCGLIAERLNRQRNTPYVLWCMDLYPEALAASGWIRRHGWPAGLLRRYARRERGGAASVIAIGADMSDLIRASAPDVRIEEVPVWSRLQASPEACRGAVKLRRERGWGDDEIILMYSGHMGQAHAVDRFAALARASAAGSHRFRFVFCGSGPRTAAWKRAGGEFFEWLSPVESDSLPAHLLAADIHLISQREGWTGVAVPSKYQAACALGRPVVFDGPAESSVARWIRESDTGWLLADGDIGMPGTFFEAWRDRDLIAAKGCRAYNQSIHLFDGKRNAARIAEAIEQTRGDDS